MNNFSILLQQMIIYFAEMTKFDLLVIDHYQPDNDNNSQGHLAYDSGLNLHLSKASALGIWFLNCMWRLV